MQLSLSIFLSYASVSVSTWRPSGFRWPFWFELAVSQCRDVWMGDQYLSWLFLCLYFFPGCCRLCYPSREQLKLIWIVAQTFSTFHSSDNATGYRRLLRFSSWYLVWVWGWCRPNKCLWRCALSDLSLTGGLIRTRKIPVNFEKDWPLALDPGPFPL